MKPPSGTPRSQDPPIAFISHSSADQAAALRLAERLREARIGVWIDAERIGLGDSIPGEISDGLESADVVLVLISRAFVKSRWCRAEYEPVLMREIDEGRTYVIPVLLEDVDLPSLLSAKRYLDLRVDVDGDISELIHRIEWCAPTARVLRLLPAGPTTEGSALALIISSTLHRFPVPMLSDEALLSGHQLVDLYRTVERFVEHFLAICDEVIPLLLWNTRGRRVDRRILAKVDRANGRLARVGSDMRDVANNLTTMLERDSPLERHLTDVLQICVGISDIEFVALEMTIGLPPNFPADGSHPWINRAWHGALWKPVLRDGLGGQHPRSGLEVSQLWALREELDGYRRELRRAVARCIAEGG